MQRANRRGEFLGLAWRDVDMDKAKLSVTQTLEETAEGLASIAITLDVYSQVVSGLGKDAAAPVDAALQAEIQR